MQKVSYRKADVEGFNILYREAGPTDAQPLLLSHGFPGQERSVLPAGGRRGIRARHAGGGRVLLGDRSLRLGDARRRNRRGNPGLSRFLTELENSMRADCTGENSAGSTAPSTGKFRSRSPNPVHTRRDEWADAAPVGGIKYVGLAKSCPGGEFPVGAKFESAMAPATTGVQDLRRGRR